MAAALVVAVAGWWPRIVSPPAPAGASEVIIPIRPRVPVGDATLFAVTVERAGGVVVSTRERIVLLAQAG